MVFIHGLPLWPGYDYHVTRDEFNWYVAQGGAGAFSLKSAGRSEDLARASSDRARAPITLARGPVGGHRVAQLSFLIGSNLKPSTSKLHERG